MLAWIWNPARYWPSWLGLFIGLFLVREVWALASGRPQDTFSAWVWRILHILPHERITGWTAADLLVFGVYIVVFVMWLPWHFFLHDFG